MWPDLDLLEGCLCGLVLAGALPLVASLLQFSLVGVHGLSNHYPKVAPYLPRLAIVVPAWNEEGVIGTTLDQLLALEYAEDRLRVFVVDDASTDRTPEIVGEYARLHPDRVVHLRRENGGQGKAHTLNYGLRRILESPWTEAFLIIDADVLFEADALWKMTRHLADPEVGAVTAYIKEGSAPGNSITRFIAFEYITAQAASRRAQNVLGTLACLAGGAQLHHRDSFERIGGEIDTSSLAEDTFTTFRVQLAGRRVVFDGNATVWAEEPASIDGVWKQRLRWARGNVQVTSAFRHIWLRGRRYAGLGAITFSLLWFTILLMPAFMIGASVGLVSLYFVDSALSWRVFELLWITNVITYLYVTVFSLMIDPATARRSWIQGLAFPGLVSFSILVYTAYPPLVDRWLVGRLRALDLLPPPTFLEALVLFCYAWLGLCMAAAWVLRRLETSGWPKRWIRLLLYVVGFGPLLCAITLDAFRLEWQGAEMKWDKTEKSGNVTLGDAT
ncbi:MAG: glycosyltransferase [Acidobacteriota bacterium]